MDKPSRLNERLTLIANIAVVLGIVFLAVELRQNTNMMRAQIRDSLTERVMATNTMMGTNPELARIIAERGAATEGREATQADVDYVQFFGFSVSLLRSWEDEYFQYELGLFGETELEPRMWQWRWGLAESYSAQGLRDIWGRLREAFSPDFRAEIDAIVAEIEN